MTKQIPKNWQEVKLGSISQVNMGQSPSSKFYNENGLGLPFFQGVAGFGDRSPKINIYCSQPIKIAEVGDVLFTVRAPVGDINLSKIKCCIGRGVASIRSAEPDNNFLYYLLKFMRPYFQSISNGTTYEAINKNDIEKAKIIIPNINIRKMAGKGLSTIDDLIENNRRRIEILEEMAQLLYREWFVEFRFPGYEKVKFVDSELGKIPEGWKVGKIGEHLQVKRGKMITSNTIIDGCVPVVAGGLTPAYYHNIHNTRAPVITISASGANSGYVNLYHEDIWASDCSYAGLKETPFVYYYFLQLKTRQSEVTNLQKGSAQPHVYVKDVMDLETLYPGEEMIETFEDLVGPLFELVDKLALMNKSLVKARDLLLPKLMSGRLRV